MKDKVSTAVIQRLPRYYRYLLDLLEENVERISSSDLAARMHVTASQIRQDLNTFGGFGQQGYGYHVPHLHAEIGKLLGIDQQKYLIIIGAGNLGQALANYQNFTKRGFQVKALFDIDPEVIGRTIQGAQVFPLEYLEAYLEKNAIDIATLTLPRDRAIEVAKRLCRCGIKAIWNFAHTDLQVDEDVLVENVHLSESLMQLSYRMIAARRKQKKTEETGDTGIGERSD
ncbi:redox-sensing transcriptional repressor Rex [Stomatobaculum longum]|uniref:redox-sensing transcriptional repressor Rex n=1 Tax=Stomatobaculum longum TaxID=796942 RepID=UPI003C75817B